VINRGKISGQKRRMNPTPRRGYRCKWCGSNEHYAWTCFKRPQTPIAPESATHNAKRMKTRRAWFKANRPDEDGHWECYLQIADNCQRLVTTETIDLEHVRPKGTHPKLRYEILNIKPACQPCNKLKRSWSLKVLAETYPRIAAMIATPEWIRYEQKLDKLEYKNERQTD
jgi:hypothetical protein